MSFALICVLIGVLCNGPFILRKKGYWGFNLVSLGFCLGMGTCSLLLSLSAK